MPLDTSLAHIALRQLHGCSNLHQSFEVDVPVESKSCETTGGVVGIERALKQSPRQFESFFWKFLIVPMSLGSMK